MNNASVVKASYPLVFSRNDPSKNNLFRVVRVLNCNNLVAQLFNFRRLNPPVYDFIGCHEPFDTLAEAKLLVCNKFRVGRIKHRMHTWLINLAYAVDKIEKVSSEKGACSQRDVYYTDISVCIEIEAHFN